MTTFNKMFMKKDVLLYSFFVAIFFIIIGAWIKILHKPFADSFLIFGLIAQLFFIIIALKEIYTSIKISKSEKVMWTFGFIFLNTICGFVYLFSARKRVINY